MSLIDISKKQKVFAPHQLVHEGITYVKVDKFDYVLAIKTLVTRIEFVKETNGMPVIAPDGLPMILTSTTPQVTLLTLDEFKKVQQSSFGMG